ncbi:MAG: efflux RND transporter periplasmic adaptor subunit [Gomphosphaeria aponina SAG 52.96 = DSM 107014]|uniref:Efflux RND transporter periplasmic adaptor subunit n=1 Tax=Gomphosphaeria aponina SAG 52.96 = DSM 107014 TaxID=1521640 RepID=A0A941GS74_9CHRO|nr:efflux RND transporter periplasmic adaptor subunit [Gomphosphaeria aponina SAG 52.96 = DSM 107014]
MGLSNSLILLLILGIAFTGCNINVENQQDTQSLQEERKIIPVNVAIASEGTLETAIEYIGDTVPVQTISLRSQVEGKLLNLNVDVGDRVEKGQILGQINDTLLSATVNQAENNLVVLQSELARAEAEVAAANSEFESAKAEFEQAENDAARYSQLAEEGAISRQEAESFQTAAKVAQQKMLTTQKQIIIEEEAVGAVRGRIAAQKALISQEKERQSYASLISPVTGVVLERANDPGDLISPGAEVLKLGDFSQIKVIVPVSELDVSKIKMGQAVEVKLDALVYDSLTGNVSSISPVADATTRQIKVEVIIPNYNNQISSGLLARVKFQTEEKAKIIIPSSAVLAGENETTVFVILHEKDGEAQVEARKVTIGKSVNGKVEIVSGIEAGERFVVNSGTGLKDGDRVGLSILSK